MERITPRNNSRVIKYAFGTVIVLFSFLLSAKNSEAENPRKVLPPNFSFRVQQLDGIMPGQNLNEVARYFKNLEGKKLIKKKMRSGDAWVVYYPLLKNGFLIHIYLVTYQDRVQELYAKFPGTFLHDVLFKELVDRLGPQDSYNLVERSAIYRWNKKSFKHLYQAACSILCFPVYYHVQDTNWPPPEESKKVKSFIFDLIGQEAW